MASDSFTNTNGTLLSAHTAGGNTWAAMGLADPQGEITNNQANCGEGFNVAARASNSTSDFSQIVFKAGDYGAESKAVHVRASAANSGYFIRTHEAPTGDAFAELTLLRNGDWMTAATGLSINRLVDNTVAILATTVGSDVQIRGWLNGAPITWAFSLPAAAGAPSQVFTDPAANTPIISGNPGFSYYFATGLSAANSSFDDWTDTQAGAPSVRPLTNQMSGGFADLTGGFQ